MYVCMLVRRWVRNSHVVRKYIRTYVYTYVYVTAECAHEHWTVTYVRKCTGFSVDQQYALCMYVDLTQALTQTTVR